MPKIPTLRMLPRDGSYDRYAYLSFIPSWTVIYYLHISGRFITYPPYLSDLLRGALPKVTKLRVSPVQHTL